MHLFLNQSDQYDVANRIVYLGKGHFILAVGWQGAYISDDFGKTLNKLEIFFCKTIGFGAPEKK